MDSCRPSTADLGNAIHISTHWRACEHPSDQISTEENEGNEADLDKSLLPSLLSVFIPAQDIGIGNQSATGVAAHATKFQQKKAKVTKVDPGRMAEKSSIPLPSSVHILPRDRTVENSWIAMNIFERRRHAFHSTINL